MAKRFVKVLVGGTEQKIDPKDIGRVHRKKVKKLPEIPKYECNKTIDAVTENNIENCHVLSQ